MQVIHPSPTKMATQTAWWTVCLKMITVQRPNLWNCGLRKILEEQVIG